MQPSRPAVITHLFLPADLNHAVLKKIWDEVTDGFGLDVRSWPQQPALSEVGRTQGLLAVQAKDVRSGLREAVMYQADDVIGIGALTAPNDGTPWEKLHPRSYPRTDAAIGEVTVFAGVWPRVLNHDARRMAGGLPDPGDGWSGAWSRTAEGVTWWDLPESEAGHRRLLVMSSAREERAMDELLWAGTGRMLPPLTRYLLQAARLRHQQRIVEMALPGLRRSLARTEQAADVLTAVLRTAKPSTHQVHEARRTIDLAQAEQGGLITATADARDMVATVRAATRNLNAALGPGVRTAPGGPVDTDRATADWLDEQLQVELTYLESARLRAEGLTKLAGAVVTQAEAQRREAIAIWQTAVLGGLVMALTATQSFEYSVPLPKSLLAPLIAVLAVTAALLPVVVLQRSRHSRPLVFGAALLGAAIGWLGVTTIHQLFESSPAPVLASIFTAAAVGGLLSVLTWVWQRRTPLET